MASNDIEVLDPAASVEKHKETESGIGLDRRRFLTALGVAGAAASVMAGADLLSSGPKAFAQFNPPIGGYKQLDVMNFLINIKYLKATLYAYLTTGADIPNYPTYVTNGSGQIYNPQPKLAFPTQQITDLFNEMYYDELNQLVDLRNLIGDVTGEVAVISRPTMDLLGTKSTSTTAVSMTVPQAIGYARMLEDLSVQAHTGAAAYLTGANLAYVSQIMATDGYHAGALRLICIQNGIPYIGTNFLTTTAAGAQSLNTYSALVAAGNTSFYLSAVPTNAPIPGNPISGVGVPPGALITAYAPAAATTFTALTNNTNVLTLVSSIAGLAPYQPVSGTNIPAGAYITAASGTSVTLSANTTGTSTVVPTGYVTSGSVSVTGVSAITGVVAGQPISGAGIPAGTTVASASGTTIKLSAAATATPTPVMYTGILTSGSASMTSVLSTTGVAAGQPITGTGIPANTTVSSVGTGEITMSAKATATTPSTPIGITGNLTNNSTIITGVPSAAFASLVAGQPISGTGIGQGTFITALNPNAGTVTISNTASTSVISPTGTLTAGSNLVTGVSNITGIAVGQPISASGLGISQVTIPAGTLIGSIGASTSAITLSPPATVVATGIVSSGSVSVTSVSPATGLAVGQQIYGNFIPAGATIAGISGSTVTLSAPATGSSGAAETLIVVAAITGTVTSGSTSLTSVSSIASLAVGQMISGNNIVPGSIILSISGSTLTLSNAATGAATAEALSINSTTITGTVALASTTVTSVSSIAGLAVGQTVTGNFIPAGTTITAITANSGTVNLSMPANYTITGTVVAGTNTVTAVANTTGLAVGQLIVGGNLPPGTTIAGVDSIAGTLTLSNLVSGTNTSPTAEPLTIYSATVTAPSAIIGAVTGGSKTVTSLTTTAGVTTPGVAAAGLAVGQGIAGLNIPSGTTIASVNASAGTLTMSKAATGTSTSLLESLTITGVSITVPLTPLTNTANAYYGSFSGIVGNAATLPGIVAVGDNVVTNIPVLSGLAIGQTIFGNYIPVGSTVTAVGAGAASATNPGIGTVTMSNAAVGSSNNSEYIVLGIPTSALLSIGVIAPAVSLSVTPVQIFTSPAAETLTINSSNVTVTVGKGLLTISLPGTATGLQTLTMLTGDLMDVEPSDPGTAALAAAGPLTIAIPPSLYSTSGPTNPTVYQGFFNTAGTGTATAGTPAGFAFTRSFGQTLSVLLGSTQTNPITYQGGFFPVGVGGPINTNADQ